MSFGIFSSVAGGGTLEIYNQQVSREAWGRLAICEVFWAVPYELTNL